MVRKGRRGREAYVARAAAVRALQPARGRTAPLPTAAALHVALAVLGCGRPTTPLDLPDPTAGDLSATENGEEHQSTGALTWSRSVLVPREKPGAYGALPPVQAAIQPELVTIRVSARDDVGVPDVALEVLSALKNSSLYMSTSTEITLHVDIDAGGHVAKVVTEAGSDEVLVSYVREALLAHEFRWGLPGHSPLVIRMAVAPTGSFIRRWP